MRPLTDNEKPGICPGCGTFSEYRDTAGFCTECHNKNYYEYRQALKSRGTEQKIKGLEFWRARGINPGDQVKTVAIAWTGLQADTIYGIAKTGCNGAYVSSKYQAGKLSPAGWCKA
jgi:hypothetical protein